MTSHWTRREFLRQAAAVTAVAGTIPRPDSAKAQLANDKLNIGIIGSGGRGHSNMMGVAETGQNIVALCDVDKNRLEASGKRFPDARKYVDFRKLLEAEKDLDAVVVSTPDHCHAPASVMTMKRSLHVYCE